MVNNADALLKLSKRVLGSTIVNGVVKRTFFKHFCAGEGCSFPSAPTDAFIMACIAERSNSFQLHRCLFFVYAMCTNGQCILGQCSVETMVSTMAHIHPSDWHMAQAQWIVASLACSAPVGRGHVKKLLVPNDRQAHLLRGCNGS